MRVDRLNLLSGNDVPSEPGFVPVSALTGAGRDLPAHDGLFTSGTLGERSELLKELKEHQASLAG